MRKPVINLVAIAVLAGVALAATGCQASSAPGKGGPEPASTQPVAASAEQIAAEGKVVPVRSAALSFVSGGTVAEVLVGEGDALQAGQPLLRLDSARPKAAVAQAEAALQRAQAHLAELKAGSRSEEVAVAEATVGAARAALQKLQEGADEGQVIAARAEAANAEAALKRAQATYDIYNKVPGIGGRPESLALEQATNTYQAAKGRLDVLLHLPRPGDLAVANAEIRRAQAQLELAKAGARPEAIAAAEADVATAAAGLEEARAALADMELRAPFAGTVAFLDARPGEQAAPGTVVVRLADLSAWQVETDDLTELSIASVGEGAPATLTFDAIPGLELKGKVTRIQAYGEQRQGDIVYTVTVEPASQDSRLRWNMTASVAIQPK